MAKDFEKKTALIFPDDYRFWDSWYLHSHGNFHALMLCAEKAFYDEGLHHEHSKLAYAQSRDLVNWCGHRLTGLQSKPNSSIWSGSAIRWENEYLLAYTRRETIGEYFAGQTICFARSTEYMGNWVPFGEELKIGDVDPNERYFLKSPDPKLDRTIHAWRDPYLFVFEGRLHMLVAAKRCDAPPGRRGCIALLQAENHETKGFSWQLVRPFLVDGYEELEVPQIYIDHGKQAWIVASTWDDRDYEISWLRGHRPSITSSPPAYRRHGYLLGFMAPSIEAVLKKDFYSSTGIVLVEPEAMFYAGRMVPERPGSVLGFDPRTGFPKLLRRKLPAEFSYVSPATHLYSP